MIRCIAIDDEPLALRLIEKFVEKTPFLEMAALCSDAYEAMEVLQKEQVDAMFVDINMPGIKGMDLVRSLDNPPLVVFTTAYSDYAIEGYDVGAIYYLLKPFGEAEFMKAAMRIKAAYEQTMKAGSAKKALTDDDIIFLKDGYSTRPVRIGDISYVESQSEYLRLYMPDGKNVMTLMSLKKMLEMLPSDSFVQTHRSYIVNIKHIKEIRRGCISMDTGSATADPNNVLPIGANYKESFAEFMSHHSL